MSSQEPHFSPRSTAKTNDKVQISGRMASIDISDVVTASFGENPSEEVDDDENDNYYNRKTIY